MKKVVGLYNFDESVDAAAFSRDLRRWGIDYAILSPNFFKNDDMRRALEKEGVKLWLNLPVFFNPAHLERHPEDYSITNLGRRAVHDWCHFVCPGREAYVESLVQEYAALAARLETGLVSLDFIRHYVFWEAVPIAEAAGSLESGCYCPACLDGFERSLGERIDRKAPAAWIHDHALVEWGEWKTRRIVEVARLLVESIRSASPASRIGIKLVPWKTGDLGGALIHAAGQDPALLAPYFDYVAPMAFTHLLRKDLAWKEALLRETEKVTNKPVMSFLQVDKLYRDEDLPRAEFEAELRHSLSDEWAGFPIFAYDQLARSEEKAEALRRALESTR